MSGATRAIEVAGRIDAQRRLILDEPLPVTGPARVRVIVLIPEQGDVTEEEWLYAASVDPAFAFLRESEEDIYTLADGKPFCDQG